MQKKESICTRTVGYMWALGGAIALTAVSLAAQAQVITRPEQQPQQPVAGAPVVVVAVFNQPVANRSIRAGGIDWACTGNRCQAVVSMPGAGMEACQALARSVGTVRFFGTSADPFDAGQLAACNTTGSPTAPAPAVSPAPTPQPQVTQPERQRVSPGRVSPDSGVVVPVRPRPGPGERPPPQEQVTAQFSYEHERLNAETRRYRGVLFEDHSTGNIARRRWTFGDNTGVDNVRDPVHVYRQEGFYQPCLTVVGPGDPRDGAPPRSSTCQILYTDSIAQLLKIFLGPVEDRLGMPSRRATETFNRLISTSPFNQLSPSERDGLQQLIGDPVTRASEIIAYLIRTTYEHYKPYIYVFASAGADVCDLVGQPECRVEAGVAGYLYLDLIDTTQFLVRHVFGGVGSEPFQNSDQTRRANYITVVANVGAGLGAGVSPSIGILFLPRPDDAANDEDFDFNSIDPSCRDEPISCALRNANSMVTVTGTILGFSAGHDGSLGLEATGAAIGASSQIVRVDLDADAILTDATAAMTCAINIYRNAGGLYGSSVDYARAFSEAFEINLLARPPSFEVDCGNIRCRGLGCADTVSSLGGFRDVSWGPPVMILRTLAQMLPAEISNVELGRSGRMRVDGTAGGLLDFSIDFEPRAGADVTLGHGNLSVNVRGYETIDSMGAKISGNVTLYGMDLGDTSIAVHTWQDDIDWRLNFEQRLFRFVDLSYSLQSPHAESLSLEAGKLSMQVADVVNVGESAATFRGDVYWGGTNLGAADFVVARDKASVRIEATQPLVSPSWPDGPLRLRGTVAVNGNVEIVHRSDGAESATFTGSATTTSEIRITAADLGVDEFDFSRSFKMTYDNVAVAVDSHGNAMVSYYYPRLRWERKTLPYPCPSTCTARVPGTDRTVTVPCPDVCTKELAVPVGVGRATGQIHANFW